MSTFWLLIFCHSINTSELCSDLFSTNIEEEEEGHEADSGREFGENAESAVLNVQLNVYQVVT